MDLLQSKSKRLFIVVLFLLILPGFASAEEKAKQKDFYIEGPKTLFVGKTKDYTITVVNRGKSVSPNCRIDLLLPPNIKCIDASVKATVSKVKESNMTKITWQPGDIKPGEQLKIIFRVMPKVKGDVKISASYTDEVTTTPVKTGGSIQILSIPHMIISTYDTEDPVEVGKNTTFVVDVTNDGSAICTNIAVEYKIPKEMKFVSAKSSKGLTYTVEGNYVKFAPLATSKPGSRITYRITCNAIEQALTEGKAKLTYDQFEKPIYDIEENSIYRN